MNEERDKRLQSAYDAASKKLKDCVPNDTGAESNYAQAYQALVAAKLVMPIKRKYRRV